MVALLAALCCSPGARAQTDAERGGLLYENHCQLCHDSVAHVRDNRRARSLEELNGWVTRWSTQQELGWGPAERADVVRYLNEHYYHF